MVDAKVGFRKMRKNVAINYLRMSLSVAAASKQTGVSTVGVWKQLDESPTSVNSLFNEKVRAVVYWAWSGWTRAQGANLKELNCCARCTTVV